MSYVQIIYEQQLKVHLSITSMDSNNFEQPGPGKPVNASRRRKKIVLSCHEQRNKPLGLQPFSGVSVYCAVTQTTPPPSFPITKSSVHDYLKTATAWVLGTVGSGGKGGRHRRLVITNSGQADQTWKYEDDSIVSSSSSPFFASNFQGLWTVWSPTVKLLGTWPRSQLTLDSCSEFGSRGSGPFSLQGLLAQPARNPTNYVRTRKQANKNEQAIDWLLLITIQTKLTWTHRSNRTITRPASFHKPVNTLYWPDSNPTG